MPISKLLRIFGFYKVKLLTSFFKPKKLFIELETVPEKIICPKCKSKDFIFYGKQERVFRDLSFGTRDQYVIYHRQRIKCSRCGVLSEHLAFADDYSHYTRRFEQYVFSLCRKMTVTDVAKHLQLSWDVVKEIDKKYLKKKYKKPNYKNLRYIAVDEISYGKYHKYLTVVLNLETGQILYVAKKRKQKTLDEFFDQIGKARCRRIKAIAMDCWNPYIASATEHLGISKIVFDKFHLLKNYGQVIDKVRNSEFRKADENEKEIIKGSKYLLLANRINIKDQQKQEKLEQILELNQNINLSYILKDELRQIWTYEDPDEMKQAIHNWLVKARASEITVIKNYADMLNKHQFGILNYCNHPISTAKLEGTNNKIKVLKRKAYGYRDMEYFKLKIYDLHDNNSIVG